MEIRPTHRRRPRRRRARDRGPVGRRTRTPEGGRLDVLAALVDAYEDKRWPLPDADRVRGDPTLKNPTG